VLDAVIPYVFRIFCPFAAVNVFQEKRVDTLFPASISIFDMKIFLIALASIAALLIISISYLRYRLVHVVDEGHLETSIDREVQKIMRHNPRNALVVGVFKDGDMFFKGYGTIRAAEKIPPDARTVFQIGSVSKLFTTSLLQILCDEGVLTMETTVGDLLGDSAQLSPTVQELTLKRLATHTSGFPKDPEALIEKVIAKVGKEKLMENPFSHIDKNDLFEYLKRPTDQKKPGRFQYSNQGVGLLGHLLEIATRKDLETLAREKLFSPLRMTDTAIEPTPEMMKHLVQGYTIDDKPAGLWTFGALAGAGAFSSNAEDMMAFLRAGIESRSSVSSSLQKTHLPQNDGDTGIGWIQPQFVDRFIGNRSIIWHNGMVGGYASYVSIDAESKTGVVVLFNKAADLMMLGTMLTRLIRTQSWGRVN